MKPGEREIYPPTAVRDEFRTEISREDYPSEGCFQVTLWSSNYGQGVQTPVRTLSKARRIARFLYATYLPEHEAEQVAKEERYAEMDKDLKERAETRRVEEEAHRAQLLAKVTPDAPRVELAECPTCQHRDDPAEFEQPVYECSRCGGTQVGEENRRCENDHIFMARVGDLACPSCEDALDETPELVSGVMVDGEFIPEDELVS